MADPSTFTIDCNPSTVRDARRGVKAVLADTPVEYDAQVVVSELATNAVLWSASRVDSGTVQIDVHYERGGTSARIEVIDAGPLPPDRVDRDAIEEYNNGLKIVGAISSDWGHLTLDDGREVWWAELSWS